MDGHEAIRAMIEYRGLSQSEVARMMGKPRQTVSYHATGKSGGERRYGVTLGALLEYADSLGFTLALVPLEGGTPIRVDDAVL